LGGLAICGICLFGFNKISKMNSFPIPLDPSSPFSVALAPANTFVARGVIRPPLGIPPVLKGLANSQIASAVIE
jgi:hypothetical protein